MIYPFIHVLKVRVIYLITKGFKLNDYKNQTLYSCYRSSLEMHGS